MVMLRDKQIITFQKLLTNHRFLDRSHAGSGKTAPAACLSGFLLTQETDKLIQYSRNPNNAKSLSSQSFLQPTSNRIVSQGRLNSRVIWIQPSSLLNKNKEELLMWNTFLKETDVKIIILCLIETL